MGLHAAAWLDLSNYCCLETLFRHPLEHLHNPGTGVCGLSAFKHTQGNQKWTVQYGRGASCPECTCMPAMRHHARVVLGRFHSVCRRVLLACMHTCIHTHGDQVDPPPFLTVEVQEHCTHTGSCCTITETVHMWSAEGRRQHIQCGQGAGAVDVSPSLCVHVIDLMYLGFSTVCA